VLEHLDAANPKALLRRSFAYRSNHQWQAASRDLVELHKVSKDPQHKKDLDLCMKRMVEEQKKKKGTTQPEKAATQPKIQEVK